METVEILQKSGRQCAEDEGASRQNEGASEERGAERRSADAAASDGSVKADQRCSPDRRMPADAAAVSFTDCLLYRDHDLTSGSHGELCMDPRPFVRRSLAFVGIRLCDLDGAGNEVHTNRAGCNARTANAAEDDDLPDARNDALDHVVSSVWTSSLLVLWQYRQFRTANDHQSLQ